MYVAQVGGTQHRVLRDRYALRPYGVLRESERLDIRPAHYISHHCCEVRLFGDFRQKYDGVNEPAWS